MVQHIGFVDPDAKTLEVFELDGATYHVLDVFSGDAFVRAVPFDRNRARAWRAVGQVTEPTV